MPSGLALAAALLLGTGSLVNPAAAAPAIQARYAGLTTCAKPKRHICGPWRLWLKGGATLPLRDAQVRSLDEHGRKLALRAPIAVDAHGRFAAYFKTSTRRLVVRNLNTRKVVSIPGTAGATPRSLLMHELDLAVSPHGRYVVVDPIPGSSTTSVIEVATGKTWALPDYARVRGFSPDGRLLQVQLDFEESVVYRPGGTLPSGGAAVVGWVTMRDGGTHFAGVSREGRTTYVRFYAAATAMEHRHPLRMTLPRGHEPRRLDYTSSGRLVLLSLKQPGEYASRSIDPATGKIKVVDSFRISTHTWDVHLAGE
ncbi:hypothetical protein [Nonomuraea soli]|uniref:DNA-binding beta-propeller fold protein YncE n=1 Tax=Nonomuraea soli TaxID=1032476 RepID=A0A7W0HVM6_9ACTN|nr:hypothetical protein [Nonomuraea soli]MBA2897340.1 DNA-binding beta-propeller fold protein YncE [Nonomuraea soli]